MSRTLVAYASKNGSTAEIAEAIAQELRAAGLNVDLEEVGKHLSPAEYSTVILGSAVYMRRWRPEARRFLKRHYRALADRDVWLFSSGPVGEADPKAEKWTVPKLVTQLGAKIGMREHVVFGGRVPTEPGSFIERSMAENTPEELRDVRDWEEIRAWARKIADDARESIAA